MSSETTIAWNITPTSGITKEMFPVPLAVVFRINGIIALLLNIVVLASLFTHRNTFRKNGLWFQLIVLCLNDIFSGLTLLTLSFLSYEPFSTNRVACRLSIVMFMSSQVMTLYNIIAIGLRRLMILINIHKIHSTWKMKYNIIQALTTLFLGLLFICVATMAFHSNGNIDLINGCAFSSGYGEYTHTASLFISCSLLIPLFVTDAVYLAIFVTLRRLSNTVVPINTQVTSSNNPNGTTDNARSLPRRTHMVAVRNIWRERNPNIVISAVLIALNLATLPTAIMQIDTSVFENNSHIPRMVKLLIASSITLNSPINPIIYTISIREFRKALVDTFNKCWDKVN